MTKLYQPLKVIAAQVFESRLEFCDRHSAGMKAAPASVYYDCAYIKLIVNTVKGFAHSLEHGQGHTKIILRIVFR
jgi:hypothetical protein